MPNKLQFRLARSTTRDSQVVEVWDGEPGTGARFLASIYPTATGLRIVSKYLGEVSEDESFPPAAEIRLDT